MSGYKFDYDAVMRQRYDINDMHIGKSNVESQSNNNDEEVAKQKIYSNEILSNSSKMMLIRKIVSDGIFDDTYIDMAIEEAINNQNEEAERQKISQLQQEEINKLTEAFAHKDGIDKNVDKSTHEYIDENIDKSTHEYIDENIDKSTHEYIDENSDESNSDDNPDGYDLNDDSDDDFDEEYDDSNEYDSNESDDNSNEYSSDNDLDEIEDNLNEYSSNNDFDVPDDNLSEYNSDGDSNYGIYTDYEAMDVTKSSSVIAQSYSSGSIDTPSNVKMVHPSRQKDKVESIIKNENIATPSVLSTSEPPQSKTMSSKNISKNIAEEDVMKKSLSDGLTVIDDYTKDDVVTVPGIPKSLRDYCKEVTGCTNQADAILVYIYTAGIWPKKCPIPKSIIEYGDKHSDIHSMVSRDVVSVILDSNVSIPDVQDSVVALNKKLNTELKSVNQKLLSLQLAVSRLILTDADILEESVNEPSDISFRSIEVKDMLRKLNTDAGLYESQSNNNGRPIR